MNLCPVDDWRFGIALAGQFFLDTDRIKLLVCLRGRGIREIHRQTHVCALLSSGNAPRWSVGVSLGADFFIEDLRP
jgi:hypothetical protein